MAGAAATLAAIEQVYRRRFQTYLRLALAMLGDRERARDAVQEAFARAVRSRRELRDEGSVEGWLWTTLVNVCRDELRRRDRPAPADPTTASSNGHAEIGACVTGTQAGSPELRAAIAALPERQRLALFLRYYADLDYDAIARVLGVERGTVAATLHAARAAVRSRLEVLR